LKLAVGDRLHLRVADPKRLEQEQEAKGDEEVG